ncbi:MAG: phosphohistidine phosphatase SixA [Coleofasciculaceae cyanobacterium]
MELYLIRHGIAAAKTDYDNDEKRPLTEEGRKKTQSVAQQIREHKLHFDLMLTSPLVRAKETAKILQDMGLSDQLEEFSPLAPDGNIQDWVSWLKERRQITDDKSIALVGHQPDLGNWAELLIWGKAQEKLVLKKAGIIGLTLPTTGTPLNQSQIFLLTSPKWLL